MLCLEKGRFHLSTHTNLHFSFTVKAYLDVPVLDKREETVFSPPPLPPPPPLLLTPIRDLSPLLTILEIWAQLYFFKRNLEGLNQNVEVGRGGGGGKYVEVLGE